MKEFFRLCLKEIQQRPFENGLRELMAKEYEFTRNIGLEYFSEWTHSTVYP